MLDRNDMEGSPWYQDFQRKQISYKSEISKKYESINNSYKDIQGHYNYLIKQYDTLSSYKRRTDIFNLVFAIVNVVILSYLLLKIYGKI